MANFQPLKSHQDDGGILPKDISFALYLVLDGVTS